MSKILENELDRLKEIILFLASMVEENVRDAVRSIERMDTDLAATVVKKDEEIDREEISVEEECLKILALHQPVAIDLRFIISILKLNNDLERIGDLAVNVAQRAFLLQKHPILEIPKEFSEMAEKVQSMLKMSLDSLVNLDVKLAHKTCEADDAVDILNRTIYDQVKEQILGDPQKIYTLIHFLYIAKHLERMADHVTNIAEDIIYMVEGEIVRHHLGTET